MEILHCCEIGYKYDEKYGVRISSRGCQRCFSSRVPFDLEPAPIHRTAALKSESKPSFDMNCLGNLMETGPGKSVIIDFQITGLVLLIISSKECCIKQDFFLKKI